MKRGQRIYVTGHDMSGAPTLEPATIVRPQPMKHYADGSDYPGWYIVRFDDGGRLMVHDSRMTIGNYGCLTLTRAPSRRGSRKDQIEGRG